ncbi:MAG TPA: mannose-1-phosphate guanylyltransferase/mannose-6-phosphate isomerase [Steroidobacteraceae bacterium]|jgi:mannose-1-phosphate guanylyltransferase/mannose-6-phosphate isomerase|nr:mannose-1-phosphate guanylyltransferase/mannose-6-phosphate isomerase [Steroidobacteraceae bacterium]
MLIPVILSGGAGTRLWPLSRELYPKQLLALLGPRTMLQQTAARVEGLECAAPVVVCNEAHRFLVAEQLRALNVTPRAIVLEPFGRNTAPAIALAALAALRDAGEVDPLLLVLPADHVIRDTAAFQHAVHAALSAAEHGQLVTFGIVPGAPETGYGYIQRGEPQGAVYRIARFIEKPDLTRARQFVDAGDYYWNSGMFLFRAGRYLSELERLAPPIAAACRAAFLGGHADLDFTRLGTRAFESCPSDSIDYAVMEKTTDAVMVPLDAGWSDVGSWSALHAASDADADGNVMHGDVLPEDSSGCYLYAESRLLATVGLTDHVVVETKDAVLVAPRNRVQDVKKLVNRLKEQGRYEHSLHREVFRPWGSYDRIESGARFVVNRLRISPGASQSLQLHHHRAEHWVVVSGTARITRGDDVFLLEENQSAFIPIGVTHRIENPGKIPVHLIEVQSGSYLGDDDIVRLEDQYGRQDGGKP